MCSFCHLLPLTDDVIFSLPPNSSLVQVLISLGPELTSDLEAVKGLLERFGITASNPPRDGLVVEVMSTLARFAAEGNTICDIGALVRALVGCVRTLYARVFAYI